MIAELPTLESEGQISEREKVMLLVDHIEADVIAKLPRVECPVTHTFTPGLYIRKIFMPKGTLVTSKIHKTRHPWNISMGVVSVWTEKEGVKHLAAPADGVTEPGTRRVIYVHTDCVWTTYHPTNETDLDKIEEQIIEKHENVLLNQLQENQLPCRGEP